MQFVTKIPINHSGQFIPEGSLVSESDLFGTGKTKTPLPLEALLAKGRIDAIPDSGAAAHPALPLEGESDPGPEKQKRAKF